MNFQNAKRGKVMTKKSTKEFKPRLDILDVYNSYSKHPKCKGFKIPDIGWGYDYDCGYNTSIDCDECKYGSGKKDPEAKCNRQ